MYASMRLLVIHLHFSLWGEKENKTKQQEGGMVPSDERGSSGKMT